MSLGKVRSDGVYERDQLGLGTTRRARRRVTTLIPLVATLHYGVVKREERYLDGKFGEAYKRYCSRVPRWL
jgi:protein-S-isoprenylcysteine O-methyltransferase Ste14